MNMLNTSSRCLTHEETPQHPRLDTVKILNRFRQIKMERGLTWEEIRGQLQMPGGNLSRVQRNLKNGLCPRGDTLLRLMVWMDCDLREFQQMEVSDD